HVRILVGRDVDEAQPVRASSLQVDRRRSAAAVQQDKAASEFVVAISDDQDLFDSGIESSSWVNYDDRPVQPVRDLRLGAPVAVVNERPCTRWPHTGNEGASGKDSGRHAT